MYGKPQFNQETSDAVLLESFLIKNNPIRSYHIYTESHYICEAYGEEIRRVDTNLVTKILDVE
jgi:hypothetical protein